MAEINLEAEQVVEEEEESAPKKKRKSLKERKGVIIFSAVLILEALVLFFLFDFVKGTPESNAEPAEPSPEEQAEEQYGSFKETLTSDALIDLGGLSITIDNSQNPRVDRRVIVPVKVQLDQETYAEIVAANEVNEHAMDLVKSTLQEEVRFFLFGEGIEKLKDPEVQKRLASRIKKHLVDRQPQFRGRIQHVYTGDINFQRY